VELVEITRSAVISRPNEQVEIKEFPIPDVEPRAMLVRMKVSGICGTDIHIYRGHIKAIRYPVIPGHENVGIISQLGEGIETDIIGQELAEGDLIVWPPGYSCGDCYYCKVLNEPTLCPSRRSYGISLTCDEPPFINGGFGEHIYLRPQTDVLKVSSGISAEEVVAAGCAGATMTQAVERSGISQGDIVVVQGAGALGLSGISLAQAAGARSVIAIEMREARLRLAERFGAEVIDMNRLPEVEKRIEAVNSLTPGDYGADVVIECTGNPKAIPEGLRMVRRGGTYVIVGQTPEEAEISLNPSIITRNQLVLCGSWAGTGRHLYRAVKLMESHKFPFKELVTHEFKLDEIAEALETAEKDPDAVKVIVRL
jgi:2-desacetyl-2-hydroxyethyl bacteriochlorophyllide A dehydrogenase